MQKQACHEFAARQGWAIVAEHVELGVSGFKVSAKDRDAIQDIQKAAAEKKFDILLCFMFDRIGRIDSETPFVVEWFINNGIEVWSVNEGQQRLDSHTDKLLNYIRYWQASGESLKTSMRVKTRISQIAQDGLYHGGSASLGYRLVKKGRTNKRGYEIHDIEVNPYEAEHVKEIYQKYIHEGMGYLRISQYLTENGIFFSNGNRITYATVRRILQTPLYTGVMVCGDVCSEHIPELQIIDDDLFQQAQKLRAQRAGKINVAKGDGKTTDKSTMPTNTKGIALLSGNAFCATCGGKLYLTHGGRKYTKKDGTQSDYRRISYTCYNKNRKLAECDGQTIYTVE
jgi:DNA invertase Pin-like site-specific DNA recombinase